MRSDRLRRAAWIGGLIAGVLLIVAGAAWIYIGADARNEVHDTITREQIVGSPDMSPEGIAPGIEEAGIDVEAPDCDVAEKPIDSGERARCFAEYMRIHALEGTGGRTYSEMGRYLDANGEEVNTEQEAAKGPNGRPVPNPARELWVSERALATGLELAYVGEQVSLFSIATGILFVVVGIGLLVMLTVGGVLSGGATRDGPGTSSGGPAS
jgi:hypothetical protein